MKILLVEDNLTIAKNIQGFLALEHIFVDVATNGKLGLEKFNTGKYDLILLDVMLPEIDGISVCKKIKEKKDIPIIMITSKSQLEDKLEGFSCGADDYITKPFDLEELIVRIKAIMKRFGKPEIFVYGKIKLFFGKKQAFFGTKGVKLTIKERNILEYLIQNYGIAVSRTDIIDFVWGGELFDADAKLDVYISNLRNKLGKDFIKTIKGFGYIIEKIY